MPRVILELRLEEPVVGNIDAASFEDQSRLCEWLRRPATRTRLRADFDVWLDSLVDCLERTA